VSLPRTFVGFSGTDIAYYHLMCAWKANDNIDFNFGDFQIDQAINSENETYIKRVCRQRILLSDTFILLIGADTYTKMTYVKWEVEVAIEKGCRLIGININNCRFRDWRCPAFFGDKGALFVPYSSRIVQVALEPWHRDARTLWQSDDWAFYDQAYTSRGYVLVGDTAILPPPVNPFSLPDPPSWKK